MSFEVGEYCLLPYGGKRYVLPASVREQNLAVFVQGGFRSHTTAVVKVTKWSDTDPPEAISVEPLVNVVPCKRLIGRAKSGDVIIPWEDETWIASEEALFQRWNFLLLNDDRGIILRVVARGDNHTPQEFERYKQVGKVVWSD
jgi:hypothetical protein